MIKVFTFTEVADEVLTLDVDFDAPRADGNDEPVHGLEHSQPKQTGSSPPANVVNVADPTPQSSAVPQDPSDSKEEGSGVSKAALDHRDGADPPVSFLLYEYPI